MCRLHVVERDGKFCTVWHSCSYLTEVEFGLGGLVHASISSQEAQAQSSGILKQLSEEDREARAIDSSVQGGEEIGENSASTRLIQVTALLSWNDFS